MLGRFVDSEHGDANAPSARFGNISMMPQMVDRKLSYCLDLHSRSGYSGSPVFVYRTSGRNLTGKQINLGRLMKFLGIHWGQYSEIWKLIDGDKIVTEASLDTDGKVIKGLSGMTCVAPAWDVLKVLELPNMVEGRAHAETVLAEQYKDKPLPPMEESADESDATDSLRDETLGRMLNTPPKPRNS